MVLTANWTWLLLANLVAAKSYCCRSAASPTHWAHIHHPPLLYQGYTSAKSAYQNVEPTPLLECIDRNLKGPPTRALQENEDLLMHIKYSY